MAGKNEFLSQHHIVFFTGISLVSLDRCCEEVWWTSGLRLIKLIDGHFYLSDVEWAFLLNF